MSFLQNKILKKIRFENFFWFSIKLWFLKHEQNDINLKKKFYIQIFFKSQGCQPSKNRTIEWWSVISICLTHFQWFFFLLFWIKETGPEPGFGTLNIFEAKRSFSEGFMIEYSVGRFCIEKLQLEEFFWKENLSLLKSQQWPIFL